MFAFPLLDWLSFCRLYNKKLINTKRTWTLILRHIHEQHEWNHRTRVMSANNGVRFYANTPCCGLWKLTAINSKMLHYYGKFHRHNSVPTETYNE
jgi:hypothetical protein